MKKPEPCEISNTFFSKHSLPKSPSLEDITRVFTIASKNFINKEIDNYTYSSIANSLYSNYFVNTLRNKNIYSHIASVIESACEINFYNENLEIYKDPKDSKQQEIYDQSLNTINRLEDEIKNFLISVNEINS